MSFLADLTFELVGLIGDLLLPESRKARLIVAAVFALAFAFVIAWLIYVVPDPLNKPSWGPAAMACSIVYGSGGSIASVLNLIGEEPERAASTFLLVTSLGLVAMPLSLLIW
jgi:hypothetical protein